MVEEDAGLNFEGKLMLEGNADTNDAL